MHCSYEEEHVLKKHHRRQRRRRPRRGEDASPKSSLRHLQTLGDIVEPGSAPRRALGLVQMSKKTVGAALTSLLWTTIWAAHMGILSSTRSIPYLLMCTPVPKRSPPNSHPTTNLGWNKLLVGAPSCSS